MVVEDFPIPLWLIMAGVSVIVVALLVAVVLIVLLIRRD